MSRYHSYLNTAKTILQQYNGEEPFAAFLKKFFSGQKKYGSRDRKTISHLCYCFFRLGKASIELVVEERIMLGLFLCSDQPNEILKDLKPEWSDQVHLNLKEKCSIINDQYSPPDRISRAGILNVFPWHDELSDRIDHKEFCNSFFIQPDLFLRLRPGFEDTVKKKLKDEGIQFETISDNCLALVNASKIDSVIELNKEAVVQDYSSQRTGEFLSLVRRGPSDKVWDCCAGSGGKSIMFYDLYPGIDLTVSDIRESIISNLKKRFSEAGITNYKSIIADLTDSGSRPDSYRDPTSDFRLIIADVPCTGSGTWSRTPDQLYYFKNEKINEYASLQKKIVSNVIPHLDPGGYFLYITCSVFKKENEDIIEFIKEKFPVRPGHPGGHLQLIKMEILKGYDKKADTMFAALLKRPL